MIPTGLVVLMVFGSQMSPAGK